jgi:diguanylate cyclase (GGDEF)-like protein
MKLLTWLRFQSLSFHGTVGLILLTVIGLVDYWTGFELRLDVFYLIPIWYATWFIGKKTGLFFSGLSVATSAVTDFLAGKDYLHYTTEIWNIIIPLAFFVIVTLLFSKLIYLTERLEQQATTDALTGIGNRTKLHAFLDGEMQRARRYDTPLSIILFDVDNFKKINDQHGHAIGDAVLKNICTVVSTVIRGTDFFARWGGEEFIVVATNTAAESACTLAEKLRQSIQDCPFSPVGPVTCSFGVAQLGGEYIMHALIKRADDALYRAKGGGKNRVEKATMP